jgi:hypothetical protein
MANFTVQSLFTDPAILQLLIDRALQAQLEPVFWTRYLTFKETATSTFEEYLSSYTGVTGASFIDEFAEKPLRERREAGKFLGRVGALGNKYQIDNGRLATLQELFNFYNSKGGNNARVVERIISFLDDDYRQLLYAPHKSMDYIVGALRSKGEVLVQGKSGLPQRFKIPVHIVQGPNGGGDLANIITWLKNLCASMIPVVGKYVVMEMTSTTFTKYIASSPEFKETVKVVLGGGDSFKVATGLMPVSTGNELFSYLGLPTIRIIDEYIQLPDGTVVNTFADDRITLMQKDNLGNMLCHTPYERTNPVPGYTYQDIEGNGFICTWRSREGQFMENHVEWYPVFSFPDKITIVDLTNTPPNNFASTPPISIHTTEAPATPAQPAAQPQAPAQPATPAQPAGKVETPDAHPEITPIQPIKK